MSVIDEVKEHLDIVEVISAYVPLQKAGRNYKALCPFHAEKTPSFIVFPESQHWHCFGACGEGGDVFSFVMKQEGWDFRTALVELARRAGVELTPRTPAQIQRDGEIDRLHELLETAARYFNNLLRQAPEAEKARNYIAKRGLNADTIQRFLLGYSPPGWDRTRTYLLQQGYSLEELVNAGMLVERDKEHTAYDRFRDRLMIPIRNAKGRVSGFGARTLDPHGVPKYLNSPQTRIFDKSRTLFGLDAARKAIRRQDQVVIVEGYMDVMQAHQAGFLNVVAEMGTALTEHQIRELQYLTKRIVLALDPDTAGVQATVRGIQIASEVLEKAVEPVFDPRGLVGFAERLDAEIRIIQLPTGKDPDDLIREEPERWTELVRQAQPVVEFYMDRLLASANLDDAQEKKSVVDAMIPLLRNVGNPVERSSYAQRLVRALNISAPQFLHELERQTRRTARRPSKERDTSISDMLVSPRTDLERYCLTALLRHTCALEQVNQSLLSKGLQPLGIQDFQDAGWRTIFESWQALVSSGTPPSAEELYASIPVDLQPQLAAVLPDDTLEFDEEDLLRDITRTVLRIREPVLAQRIQELYTLIRDVQESGSDQLTEYMAILRSYTAALRQVQKALAQT